MSEGYVAVRSDPSLAGDMGQLSYRPMLPPDQQRSTPNLHDKDTIVKLPHIKTPATSAGYFSSSESDQIHENLANLPRSCSGLMFNKNNGTPTLSSPPYSSATSPLPIYSRHSFTPPNKLVKRSQSPPGTANNLGDLQYVAVVFNNDDSRLTSPDSLYDGKRRPSSLVNVEQMDNKSDMSVDFADAPGAYSIIGKRKNTVQPMSSSQGYVTLSNHPQSKTATPFKSNTQNTRLNSGQTSNSLRGMPSEDSNSILEDLESTPKVSPLHSAESRGYVALGERGFPSSASKPSDSGQPSMTPSAKSHYVTAAPDQWAFNCARPRQLDFADEVRFVASAPVENQRGRKVSQKDEDNLNLLNGRPNTSEGIGRPRYQSHSPSNAWTGGAPSLSKQSSGYVSQEALSTDPLVMSPKRLFAQTSEAISPKTIPHEVSFV